MDFQAVDKGFGLLWRKDLVERSRGVRIEIVHDTEHAGRFRLCLPHAQQFIRPQYLFWYAPARLDNFQDIYAHILW